MEVLYDILYKIVIALVVGLLSFCFKPVREKFKKTKLYSFIMRKLGKERYKVIITGSVFHKSNQRNEICTFEVELPYKDISEDSMPISRSNDLIIKEVNKKYGRKFNTSEYWLNHIGCRNVTYYKKDDV
ncbi:hypothetical protein [Alkalihalobacillus deserti]|uniref:hypothetical protein n=1 Tax=Alkalihalobacillus deserti TaxID=2879466 RepID=UPI001D14F81D|nr:hypothetical protein [Alkalihalobacillus deserti]